MYEELEGHLASGRCLPRIVLLPVSIAKELKLGMTLEIEYGLINKVKEPGLLGNNSGEKNAGGMKYK